MQPRGRQAPRCANFAHVATQSSAEWERVGQRVAEARAQADLTQAELGRQVGLDRTAIAKIESGARGVNALELAKLATALQRPIEWFVTQAPPAVVSRRAEEDRAYAEIDVRIDLFARDVELLLQIRAIEPTPASEPNVPSTVGEAEALAREVRARLGQPEGPLLNLIVATEQLGLYVSSEDLGAHNADGAYVAIDGAGVAVINGTQDAGRRRFTLAHELGHHAMADEFSTDWHLDASRDERERLINAFAAHLLMPRSSILSGWRDRGGPEDPRPAAIRLATDYRVSWSALCGHLLNLDAMTFSEMQALAARPPTRADLIELGTFVVEELAPPQLSSGLSRGILRAYQGGKLGASRVVELLRGTVDRDELPLLNSVPLQALRSEVEGSG
jgi:Zn-dependent peptidase ImmA (M78 family)/DNA-binding XRE family transcriptional regulator